MTTLKNKIKELRNEWLNKEITLSNLDEISGTDMSGKYDLRRDLMSSKTEGSYSYPYDNGEINIEFKFTEESEIDFGGRVIVTDIYEL